MTRGEGWWPEQPGDQEAERDGGDGEDEEGGAAPGTPPPRRPPRGLASRDRPKAASRYSLVVGLAFVALVIVAVLNAVQTEEDGILGADPEASRGTPVPEFAAPEIPGGPAGDANIAQDDCESSANPCPDGQARVPACEVDAAGAVRVCDLFDKPLAISFWFTRGGDCTPTQDAFDAVAAERSREVNFLSVNVLDDRAKAARIVSERGWRLPVVHDADGAVSNLLGVGVCPSIVLAYPGGILHAAEIKPGNFGQSEVDALVDDLLRASAERERALR